MKNFTLTLLVLISVCTGSLFAQQIPLINLYSQEQWLFNPAIVNGPAEHKLLILNKQRRINFGGNSQNSRLHFSTSPWKPANPRETNPQSLGGMISFDQNHTDWRLNLLGNYGMRLVNDSGSVFKARIIQLSIGGGFGFFAFGSTYSNVRKVDPNDLFLQGGSTFLELDANAGLHFNYVRRNLKVEASAAARQLTKNVLSKDQYAPRFVPHYLVGLKALAKAGPAWIGPTAMINGVLYQKENDAPGWLDAGLMAQFPRAKNFWFSLNYRHKTAVHAGMGIELFRDTLNTATLVKDNALALSFNFEVPIHEGAQFWPSMEVGLNYRFGKRAISRNQTIIIDYRGPFWVDNGNLQSRVRRVMADVVPGLEAEVENEEDSEFVTMSFEFDDFIADYREGGWDGVPKFIGLLVDSIIGEALVPTPLPDELYDQLIEADKDPEFWGSIESLESVQVLSFLKDSPAKVEFGEKTVFYSGEFDTLNPQLPSASIVVPIEKAKVRNEREIVLYNDVDTVLTISPNQYVSNLDLAFIKVVALRKMITERMNLNASKEQAIPGTEDLFEGVEKKFERVIIKPDNSHQPSFIRNRIVLRFRKF